MEWKTLVLSSGIEKLAQIALQSGTDRKDSEEVRVCDLPAVNSEQTGVFEALPEACASLDIALAQMESACAENYGTALRAFLNHISGSLSKVKSEVQALMSEFEQLAAINKGGTWEARFAKKFGLAYAAGVLGVKFKVLPWTKDTVSAAMLDCYRRARGAIPDADAIYKQAWKTYVRRINDGSSVVDLRKLKKNRRVTFRPSDNCGFIEDDDKNGLHLVVNPDVFRSWFGTEQEAQLLLQGLDQRGKLIRAEKRVPTCQRMYAWEDKRRRYYFIRVAKRKKPGRSASRQKTVKNLARSK